MKRLSAPIILVIMFSFITKPGNAQKCSPIHSCPAGYTCVGYHCVKTVSPPPLPGCRCVRPVPPGCAAYCGFLSDENNGTSSITISSASVPQTITINFQLEDAASISLKIYEASGRLIRTLAAEKMEQGSQQVEWNEKDDQGNTVSAGIYILQFDTPNKSETKKLAVIN